MSKNRNVASNWNVKEYTIKLFIVLGIGFLAVPLMIVPLMLMANDISYQVKQIVFPILYVLFLVSNCLAFFWLKNTKFNYYLYYPTFALIMAGFITGAFLIESSEQVGYIFLGIFITIFAFYFAPIWIHFRTFKLGKREN